MTPKTVKKPVVKSTKKPAKPVAKKPVGLVKESIKRISKHRPIGIVRKYDKKTWEFNDYSTKTSIAIIKRRPFVAGEISTRF